MSGCEAPLLSVDTLRVEVRGRCLVDAVSFDVRAGDVWCVLGANGAGKTLLLHTLAGLRRPDAGRIALAGTPLCDWPLAAASRQRGFLPQFNMHAFPMTAQEAVIMGRHPHLSPWAWESDADTVCARAALADVGLGGFESRDVTTLSGGERQRVAIAMLFAQDVSLMLLDEPLAHLDLKHQLRILDRLVALAGERRGIVLSIHDLTLARRCASHALLLCGDGRAYAGAVDAVMSESALSDAFGCRITRIDAAGRPAYLVP